MEKIISFNKLFSDMGNNFDPKELIDTIDNQAYPNTYSDTIRHQTENNDDFYYTDLNYLELTDYNHQYLYVLFDSDTNYMYFMNPYQLPDQAVTDALRSQTMSSWERMREIVKYANQNDAWGIGFYAPEFNLIHTNHDASTGYMDYIIAVNSLTIDNIHQYYDEHSIESEDLLLPFETPYTGPAKLPNRKNNILQITGLKNGQLYKDIDRNLTTYETDYYTNGHLTDYYLILPINELKLTELNNYIYRLRRSRISYESNARHVNDKLFSEIVFKAIEIGQNRLIDMIQNESPDLTVGECQQMEVQLDEALKQGAKINVILPMESI